MPDRDQSDTPAPPTTTGVDAAAAATRPDVAVGGSDSYSGQAYDDDAHAAERASTPPPQAPVAAPDARDVPVEAGRRGWIDQRTGEVHGSGSGAGPGGNPDEDYDTGTPGG